MATEKSIIMWACKNPFCPKGIQIIPTTMRWTRKAAKAAGEERYGVHSDILQIVKVQITEIKKGSK